MTKDFPKVEVKSRVDLRAWLTKKHAQATTVWLVKCKQPSPHYIPTEEIIEELLCWGWIDSVVGKLDAIRTMIRISPRNPKSNWSAFNKALVEKARASGAMTPAGEAMITFAQETGTWTFLDDVDRLEVPPDMAAALGDLRPTWEAYPKSVKRGTLEWIKTAKTEATRSKRIADVVNSAQQGVRPSIFRR
ncbi:YdeI family protein [Cognatishimia sp. MH4019]|uniref:YdeI/OmpD-associated family protein n=1 Tax=Cognatishimia sp. MH4019 TaxID=2854030 RepID=UPI001CD758FA|nr:YdeI/OmpD-associated family protein [Cognatishimia sp. MH4019]